MPNPNRKQVNDKIEEIVRRYVPGIRAGGEMRASIATGEMIRELQAHSDATVEAALTPAPDGQ